MARGQAKRLPKNSLAITMIVPPAMQTQINLSSYTLRLCSQIIDNCRDHAVIGLRLAREKTAAPTSVLISATVCSVEVSDAHR